MTRPHGLVAALGFLLAAVATAEPPSVRLLAPLPGSTLTAGSTLTFAWELVGTPPPSAAEWELFLSLDAGHSYPVRLTPHLDLRLRRVTVRLPEVPSDSARFLLRVGDEDSESAFELGGSFTLVAADLPWTPPVLSMARHAGEAALPGLPGVNRWVEGGRDGTAWREVETQPDPRLNTRVSSGSLGLVGFLPPRRPTPPAVGASLPDTREPRPPEPAASRAASPTSNESLLLLLCRANC